MGVKISIGSSERNIENIDRGWIIEQVNRRRGEGVPVCVRILIDVSDVNLSLATSDCPSSRGIRRNLTGRENELLSLWNRLQLSESNFSSGNLFVFLEQLRF